MPDIGFINFFIGIVSPSPAISFVCHAISFSNNESGYSSLHTASVVSSLIKMFWPTIAGCAQVGFSAT